MICLAPGVTPRRLDQILASFGYCSRREAKDWLRAGRVTVNGGLERRPECKAAPDSVRVDGEPVECPGGLLALLHKPAGFVCSRDEREGPSVFDLLPPRWSHRNPPVTTVGRLDKDTTGVLLITDQGELVQRWTSPRHKVPKVYEVTVDRPLRADLPDVFGAGTLVLAGECAPCLPARLEIVSPTTARLELTEGRYHQVKRMFAALGWNVVRLHRSRFGQFELEDLPPGQWRLLPLPGLPSG